MSEIETTSRIFFQQVKIFDFNSPQLIIFGINFGSSSVFIEDAPLLNALLHLYVCPLSGGSSLGAGITRKSCEASRTKCSNRIHESQEVDNLYLQTTHSLIRIALRLKTLIRTDYIFCHSIVNSGGNVFLTLACPK